MGQQWVTDIFPHRPSSPGEGRKCAATKNMRFGGPGVWNRSLVSLQRRLLITTLIVWVDMLVWRGQLDFVQCGSAIRNNDPAHTHCTAQTHTHIIVLARLQTY